MKNLNKTLIIICTRCCFAISPIFADDSDCWNFWGLMFWEKWSFDIVESSRWTTSNSFTKFLTVEEQLNIITKDDLNTAILNLKKYCCDSGKWGLTKAICSGDASFFNENVPDSPYLFDHIFDVMMRRLNWQNGDVNIYTKTKMSLDEKWATRRKWIDEQAESTDWSNPEIIINEYKKYWEQNKYNIAQKISTAFWLLNNKEFLEYVSWNWDTNDSKSISDSLKHYNDRTLYDRYINTCALSEYFYALLGGDSADKNRTIYNSAEWACNNIVKRTINWENTYVSLVTQRSSNLFLSNYVEWYFSYLYERQQKLQKLRKDARDKRFDVTKAVPCLQRKCVK